MNSSDLDDDLITLNIDDTMSDLSTNDLKSSNKKMSDIIDLFHSTEFNDKQGYIEFGNYLPTHSLQNVQDNYEKSQWETEENYLKYGSKQLSPSDYLTRTSLYNRPIAFEKHSCSWARDLLDNFKKSNQKSKSSSINLSYFFPLIKKSSSFDHHVQYIEHLNECNDYPAYLEYLRENRSQLFYTLTDSIDIIDGLIGTVVS